MSWDPELYARYEDHRLRPGLELLSRIPHDDPGSVVDLGCGPGTLTALLAQRWPAARITGVDDSPEMLEAARAGDGRIRWVEADIRRWEPDSPVDVVFSNAALHWLDDHDRLFRRLSSLVSPGGAFAVQMPDNWRSPTHTVPATVLDSPGWPAAARQALMRDRLAEPSSYRAWLAGSFTRLDMWSTTYFQVLDGTDPVLTWVKGSLLRPVLAVLSDTEAARFEDRCRAAYAEAYPPESDGTTILPFRRFFLVASGRIGSDG